MLLNPYQTHTGELFLCPFCHEALQADSTHSGILLRERIQNASLAFPTVQDIPETDLSRFIEQRLHKWITKERTRVAQTLQMEYEDTEYPEQLSIRLVMNEVQAHKEIE